MSIKDIASQSCVILNTRSTAWLKRHNSGVHVNVSPGSAEMLIRRGGITNHHLIAYSLSNMSVKNYQNSLMCIKVKCAKSVSFFWHDVLIVNEVFACNIPRCQLLSASFALLIPSPSFWSNLCQKFLLPQLDLQTGFLNYCPDIQQTGCLILAGHISALPNMVISWFLGPELSLADGVTTLQLQLSETHFSK